MSKYRSFRGAISTSLDEQTKVLAKNGSWLMLSNLNAGLCDFLRAIFIARGLGVELFGQMLIILALSRAIMELFNLNVGTALTKFGAGYKVAGDPARVVALLRLCFLVSILASAVGVLMVAGVTYVAYDVFIDTQGLWLFIVIYTVSLSLEFIDHISLSLLRLSYKFKINSIIKIISDWVFLAVIILISFFYRERIDVVMVGMAVALVLRSILFNGAAFFVEERVEMGLAWEICIDQKGLVIHQGVYDIELIEPNCTNDDIPR